MLNWIESLLVKATKPIKPADDVITVSRKDAVQLNKVGIGNHIFLTLELYGAPLSYEIVRYDHAADIVATGCPEVTMLITRDVNGTGRRAFPVGTCAAAKLNSPQLSGIIANAITQYMENVHE